MKKEILEKIERLENELKELKNEIKEEKHYYELFLRANPNDGDLEIGFEVGDTAELDSFLFIGYIESNRKCRILNHEKHGEHYNLWVEHGMKVKDCEPIEWRGGKYIIDEFLTLKRIDVINGSIYDIENAMPVFSCGDENILRYEHNGTPILH